MEVKEENPDDAAAEKSGNVGTTSRPFICHARFESPCDGMASALFPKIGSCQERINHHHFQFLVNIEMYIERKEHSIGVEMEIETFLV